MELNVKKCDFIRRLKVVMPIVSRDLRGERMLSLQTLSLSQLVVSAERMPIVGS